MKKLSVFIIANALIIPQTFGISTPFSGKKPWGTPEHIESGNNLQISFCNHLKLIENGIFRCDSDNIFITKDYDLTLDNNLKLKFGEILALSGDFFALPGRPITGDLDDPKVDITDLEALKPRFIAAFNDLNKNTYALHTAPEVLALDEEDATDFNYTRILGKEYLDLAENNFDHFAPNSWYAYAAGHALALESAIEAHNIANTGDLENSNKKLVRAYNLEAYAQHYLTDNFSAGHMRTPRKKLQNYTHLEKTGAILSKFMHDEDSKFGVNVYNARGDKWRAYGDHFFSQELNKDNKNQLHLMQQAAIDQIYNSYRNSETPDIKQSLINIKKYLPQVAHRELNDFYKIPQTAELFIARDGGEEIIRRQHLDDLYDYDWGDWNTMLTPFQLLSYDPEDHFDYPYPQKTFQ